MILNLHWTKIPNFSNKVDIAMKVRPGGGRITPKKGGSTSLSFKDRLGTKPSTLGQSVSLNIERTRLDLKFKQKLEKALIRYKHLIRADMKCVIYIPEKLGINLTALGRLEYTELTCRNPKEFSNKLTNILILRRNAAERSGIEHKTMNC